jgi:hypothetical protein
VEQKGHGKNLTEKSGFLFSGKNGNFDVFMNVSFHCPDMNATAIEGVPVRIGG